jgi:HSP20 family protein
MARDEVHFPHTLFLHAAGQPRQEAWQPRADIYCVPGGWLVKLELAGVRPKDVRLTVRGSTLLVQGTRRDEFLHEVLGCHCHRMEITYSRFERLLELSGISETARIEAAYREGMLLVRIVTEGTP